MVKLLGMLATVIWAKTSQLLEWDAYHEIDRLRARCERAEAENFALRQDLANAQTIDAVRRKALDEARRSRWS